MNFVKLTLSSNKLYVLINTEKIIEFFADTDKDGLPCTKIITDDGDYTTVKESLSQVLTAIGKAKGKEIHEEPQLAPAEIVANEAARILKGFCADRVCYECIFSEKCDECRLKDEYLSCWVLPKGDE